MRNTGAVTMKGGKQRNLRKVCKFESRIECQQRRARDNFSMSLTVGNGRKRVRVPGVSEPCDISELEVARRLSSWRILHESKRHRGILFAMIDILRLPPPPKTVIRPIARLEGCIPSEWKMTSTFSFSSTVSAKRNEAGQS